MHPDQRVLMEEVVKHLDFAATNRRPRIAHYAAMARIEVRDGQRDEIGRDDFRQRDKSMTCKLVRAGARFPKRVQDLDRRSKIVPGE
jgi:hypothetical protein